MSESAWLDKQQLCAALQWSRPRLDRRLDSDANFPVRQRGGDGAAWLFDLVEVRAHLDATPAVRRGRPPKSVDAEAAASKAPVVHRGEATAKQRRDEVAAALMEDKLRRSRKELLEAEDVRLAIGSALVHFGNALDSLPDQIIKLIGVEQAKAEPVRELLDHVRSNVVRDLQQALNG